MKNNEKTRGLGCFNHDGEGGWETIDMYEQYTYKIPVSSIKVKGILRITRDLTLIKENSQIHMVLFLDKNTPEKYLYHIPHINYSDYEQDYNAHSLGNNLFKQFGLVIKNTGSTEGLSLLTTYYIRSPYENDMDNQKLLKSLLSEKEYASFMNKRFSCTYVAVECELSDFMTTSFMDQPTNDSFYTDKYSIGIDISTRAEYFNSYNMHEIGGNTHAKLSNYKVIDRHSVSIYKTTWYDEEYYYSSYAKNGVIAEPCSYDTYINVREKPDVDSKVLLQPRVVIARPSRTVYPPSQKWLNTPTEYYTQEDIEAGYSKLDKYDMYFNEDESYKIYPIFVHDILEGDWCKVTIYKSNYMYDINWGYNSDCIIDKHNLRKKIVYSPEEVYLMDGYIHASQLHPISVIRVKDTI